MDSNLITGSSYTIKDASSTGVARTGLVLSAWNTRPDGSGTAYLPGQVISVTGNLTLYAQWVAGDTVTLVYEPNVGGTGGLSLSATRGSTVTVLGSSIVSGGGRVFLEWNTQPGGSGVSYLPGQSIMLAGNTILFARWRSLAPTVNAVTEFDDFISGTGTYFPASGGSHITVVFPSGLSEQTSVATNSTWSVIVPSEDMPLLAGMQITVYQTELNMQTSDPVVTTVPVRF